MIQKLVMTWTMGRITEKHEKWEMHTLGPAISRENWNRGNEPQTILNENMGRNSKTWKIRNTHCWTWNMARYSKTWKWNTSTVGPGIMQGNWKTRKWDTNTIWPGIWWEVLKNIEKKEMCPVGPGVWRETENHGKWETHNERPGIWQEIVKTVKS